MALAPAWSVVVLLLSDARTLFDDMAVGGIEEEDRESLVARFKNAPLASKVAAVFSDDARGLFHRLGAGASFDEMGAAAGCTISACERRGPSHLRWCLLSSWFPARVIASILLVVM